MRTCIEERNTLVLAMNIDQPPAHFTEHSTGHRSAVDARDTPPRLGIELARQDDLVFALVNQAILLKYRQDIRAIAQREDTLDTSDLAAGTHKAWIDFFSTQHSQRIDDDRLTGSGFTGQDIEGWSKGQVEAVDDGKVADIELNQHRKIAIFPVREYVMDSIKKHRKLVRIVPYRR